VPCDLSLFIIGYKVWWDTENLAARLR